MVCQTVIDHQPPSLAPDKELIDELRTSFPHIAQLVESTWGQPDCERYLGDLMFDNRGNRNGFPTLAWKIIFKLYVSHPIYRPQVLATNDLIN